MNRRDFLTGLSFGGYSLVYYADTLSAAPTSAPSMDRIRAEMDRVAPPDAQRGLIGHEPNMKLVELETDILVA
ncbi:MAG: FAD-dependent oxidoreductase, partial [bacterium]|nr:FAD-dependent oxidoreductase [bacterium]